MLQIVNDTEVPADGSTAGWGGEDKVSRQSGSQRLCFFRAQAGVTPRNDMTPLCGSGAYSFAPTQVGFRFHRIC